MKYIIRLNDIEYEVEVERGQARIISKQSETAAPTPAVPIAAPAVPRAAVAAPSGADVSKESTAVRAPLPGSIVDIRVSEGQPVKAGQVLIILEAMKMENEITSPSNGTIKRVLISKGASVATNDALIVLV